MRRTCIAILAVLLSSGSLAETSEPLCVLSPEAMPESWRPSDETHDGYGADPWTASEADDALFALKTGLDEMLDLYSERPSAVTAIWEDAVGSLIEVTYSGANAPALDEAARAGALRNLTLLVAPFLDRRSVTAACDEFEDLLPLAIYAHKFYPAEDSRTETMVALTNSAYQSCGSLEVAIDFDYQRQLQTTNVPTDAVFDLVIWSLLFIEAELVPGLELPAESREFAPMLWRYLETYPLVGSSAYEDGAWNEEFVETAYLATHIAYIPTGNHRHPIYVEDAPNLYRFHREEFYPVLENGELDLVAEFVDSLRQYGCTEENDLQVRDGTRFLLELFHNGGDKWMTYREPEQTDAEVDDYDLIHKAWTGVLGVRLRKLEPADPGTYGGVVRRWLPHPR